MMAMASSCKHIIQIIQLLDERSLSFSFCLSRDEVLVLSGFGLLFQCLGLEQNSKILKDNGKMLAAVIDTLKKSNSPCASEFERVASSFVSIRAPPPPPPPKAKIPVLSRHNSDGGQTIDVQTSPSSTRKQLKAIASRLTAAGGSRSAKADVADGARRATVANVSLHPQSAHTRSQPSLPNTNYDPSSTSRSEPARSPVNMYSRPTSTLSAIYQSAPPPAPKSRHPQAPQKLLNLDYLSFGNEPDTQTPGSSRSSQPVKTEPVPTDWEKLLGSLDNGETNIYDACYGGPPVDALLDVPSLGMSHTTPSATAVADATSVAWNADLWALCQTETNTSTSSSGLTPGGSGQAGSILSFSTDEGLSSSDDFTADWASASSGNLHGNTDTHRAIVLPHGDDVNFESSWEAGMGL